jgi:hypothetical protein
MDRVESPVIALQSPLTSKKAISKVTEIASMDVDLQEEPESSQAMETDMISTQNSFILQLADSQSTLTPFSPFKQSQHRPVDGEKLSKENNSAMNPPLMEEDKQEIQGNEVVGTTNKQIDPSIGGEQTDTSLEASKQGATISTSSVADNEPISESNKIPLHSSIKSKPIPLYESLVCEDSSSQASMNLAQIGASTSIPSNQRLGELQDTSQITNSGIDFECTYSC